MKNDWNIDHIAIVVRDLEKTLEQYCEKLGTDPWTVIVMNNDIIKDYYVDGKLVTEEFEFKVAFSTIGNMKFEIIQPVKGPNCYWKFLEEKGEGLHHIKFNITQDEIKQAVKTFTENGFEILQTGKISHDTHYYPNTQDALGLLIEFGDPEPVELPFTLYPET